MSLASSPTPRAARTVTAFALLLVAARAVWISCVPDVDMDAYGHFLIGRDLAHDPANLAAHWVWLPLYHYLLAALVACGVGFASVRVLSAFLIGAASLMIRAYVARRGGPSRLALAAALLFSAASIPNLLGVSAQQEALFTATVLGTTWAIDARRPLLAGALLAGACLVRYEAWGACAFVVAQPIAHLLIPRILPARANFSLSRALGPPLSWLTGAAPLLAIFGWIAIHRVVDGTWFGFLRELVRYTHAQRDVFRQGALMELLWFPVLVPLLSFGPAVLLVPYGISRVVRPGWIVPAGIYAFLLVSYAGKGALGGARYYGSLTPFVCISVAYGAERLATHLRDRVRPLLFGAIVTSFAAATSVSLVRTAAAARANETTLRAAETRTK